MIIEEGIKDIKKELRRAKRTKKWLLQGNVIPPSTKEKKWLQNKSYREKIQKEREKKAQSGNDEFKLTYKNDLFDYANSFNYNHKGSLTYSYNISMNKAHRDAIFIFELLLMRKHIQNYFFVVEYEPSHVHIHYIMNTGQMLKDVKGTMHIMHNGKYEKGFSWCNPVLTNCEKENAILYMIDKLQTNNRYTHLQSEIDYWSINTKLKVSEPL